MGSPRKGGSFERDIAKILSKWWAPELRKNVFWRTRGSGALAAIIEGQNGDICAVDPIAAPITELMCFECKRQKLRNFTEFFTCYPSFIEGWIFQTIKQAEEKVPVLFFQFDRKPIMVGVDTDFLSIVGDCVDFKKSIRLVKKPWYDFTIFKVDGFLTISLKERLKDSYQEVSSKWEGIRKRRENSCQHTLNL